MEQVAADANPPVAQLQPNSPASAARYALTDDLLAGRFFSIDVRGQVTGWNPRAEAAFGWPTHHVSGTSLFDNLVVSGLGFAPQDLEDFYAAAAAGAGRRVRVLINHQAGSQLPVELSIVPIQLAKAYELNAFLQDVSTSTASGVASEIGRVRSEHAAVLDMIAGSLELDPAASAGEEARLAGALVVFHIDAGAMTMMPPGSSDPAASSTGGGTAVPPAGPPVGTVDADVARAEAERVRAQIDDAHAAAEEARTEAEVARQERDDLRSRLDAAEAGSSTEAADARREADALRARADQAEAGAESLRTEADEARRQVERLAEQLARAEQELTAAREERDALRAEIDELRDQVAAAGQAEAALTESREQVSALEADLTSARGEVEAAQSAAAAAEQRASEIAADAVAAREGGEAAEAAVAAAREEINAAREEAEGARGELAAAHERMEALEADLAEARENAAAAKAEADAARENAEAALADEEAVRADAEAARADAEAARGDAEAARADAEAARADAEAARADAEAARAETETIRQQTVAAVDQLAESRAQTEVARAEGQSASEMTVRLQTDLASARADAEGAKTQLEAARAELKDAREQVDALQAEIDAVRAQADSAGKTVGAAQAELGEARSDAVKARAEADKATADAAAARAAAERAEADADAARADAAEARAAAEAATAEAEQRPFVDPVFERVFDGATIGMAIKENGRLTHVNRALSELTGRDADDLLRIDPVELVHPDERDAHTATENQLLAGQAASSNAEARIVHATGEEVHVRESTSVLEDGKLLLQFELAEPEAHTAVEDHDPVTGLFNRRRFEEELSRHVAEAAKHGDRGAALMLDLDGDFAKLDDAQGDELLRTVADALKQNISESEVLAHLGGDEFAVLLPHADAASARKIAANIVEAVGPQVVKVGDQSVRVTIDVGVALFDEREDPAAAAPTAEPATGENLPAPIVPSEGGQSTALAPADGIVDRIRKALAEDGFTIYAQPIIDLHTSEITQYELLLRMKDDSGRLMLPDKFLPAAQRAGLMPAIDQWVVRKAIGLIAEAAADGRRLLLEVNISSDSIDDPALTALIEGELDATGVDPRMLVIEVTEDAAQAKIEQTIKLSKWIRSMGCRFALDDFGSTFATVKYLKDMPVDYFKLDGDLIVTLPESRTNQLLLNALMDVARGTGTQTIAVYVPDDETLIMLRQFGIGYGQGNRVGRPRPVTEI